LRSALLGSSVALFPIVSSYAIAMITTYIVNKKAYKKTASSKELLSMKNVIRKEFSIIVDSLSSTIANVSLGVVGSLLA